MFCMNLVFNSLCSLAIFTLFFNLRLPAINFSNMAASITNLEQNEQQAEYIEILRNRVEQILEQLRLRDPKAVEHGLSLQNQHGLHPYWSFAVTSVSI